MKIAWVIIAILCWCDIWVKILSCEKYQSKSHPLQKNKHVIKKTKKIQEIHCDDVNQKYLLRNHYVLRTLSNVERSLGHGTYFKGLSCLTSHLWYTFNSEFFFHEDINNVRVTFWSGLFYTFDHSLFIECFCKFGSLFLLNENIWISIEFQSRFFRLQRTVTLPHQQNSKIGGFIMRCRGSQGSQGEVHSVYCSRAGNQKARK